MTKIYFQRPGASHLVCSLVYVFLLIFSEVAFSQQKVIQYDKDFVFKDGIYLSIFDFKKNNPIPTSRIVFSSNKGDKDFLKYVTEKNTLDYLDEEGKTQEVKMASVWGYCSSGSVYINHGTGFNRVTIIGSFSHFLSTIAVQTGYDPFYYTNPFGSPYPRYTYVTEQFILDFDSGKIVEFNVNNMEALLQKDEALYKDFMQLKKRQKRDGIFLYLRKYNEKHPVFFPE